MHILSFLAGQHACGQSHTSSHMLSKKQQLITYIYTYKYDCLYINCSTHSCYATIIDNVHIVTWNITCCIHAVKKKNMGSHITRKMNIGLYKSETDNFTTLISVCLQVWKLCTVGAHSTLRSGLVGAGHIQWNSITAGCRATHVIFYTRDSCQWFRNIEICSGSVSEHGLDRAHMWAAFV